MTHLVRTAIPASDHIYCLFALLSLNVGGMLPVNVCILGILRRADRHLNRICTFNFEYLGLVIYRQKSPKQAVYLW